MVASKGPRSVHGHDQARLYTQFDRPTTTEEQRSTLVTSIGFVLLSVSAILFVAPTLSYVASLLALLGTLTVLEPVLGRILRRPR